MTSCTPCLDPFLGEVRKVLVGRQALPKSWDRFDHPAVDFGDMQVQQAAAQYPRALLEGVGGRSALRVCPRMPVRHIPDRVRA